MLEIIVQTFAEIWTYWSYFRFQTFLFNIFYAATCTVCFPEWCVLPDPVESGFFCILSCLFVVKWHFVSIEFGVVALGKVYCCSTNVQISIFILFYLPWPMMFAKQSWRNQYWRTEKSIFLKPIYTFDLKCTTFKPIEWRYDRVKAVFFAQ